MALSSTYPLVHKDVELVTAPDLESLVENHYSRILRAALVMTGNQTEAEDLTQETFLHAMQSLKRFAGGSRVDTWLYAIMLNQHRRRLRGKVRRWRRWLRWFDASGRQHESMPTDPLLEAEWKDSLWSRVAELSEPHKQVILLRFAEGYSYNEISRLLDCPIGTVKSRMHHGLAALRRRLNASEQSEAPSIEAVK